MRPTIFEKNATFDQIVSATSGLKDGASTTLGMKPDLDGPHQPAMMPTQALDAGSKEIPAKSDDPDWNTKDSN